MYPSSNPGDPAMSALCHCQGCQNWGGSAFSSNVGVPTTNFSITKGNPKNWVRTGDVSGKENRHFFCGGQPVPTPTSHYNESKILIVTDCGSSLFSRPEVLEGITLIKSGCLDETNIPISLEMFVTRRCDYVAPVANAPQAPEMP